MNHKYPFGAIVDEAQLQTHLGETLYSVHALGADSFLTVMYNIHNLRTGNAGFRNIDYNYTRSENRLTGLDETGTSHYCLGDFNIGEHHNDHYLFYHKDDAEGYLEWAEANTENIDDDSKFSRYYYID